MYHWLNLPTVTPFSSEGKEMLSLLKKKAPESEIDTLFERIHTQATDLALQPELCSTDAYLTSICYIGSKSLSHVLSQIDRCKERLLSISGSSPAAQKQIINSVMDYWKYQSGVGVKIVDKLLNYTILTPDSVIEWALSDSAAKLAEPHVFEMVELTVQKVAKRVRQIVKDRNVPGLTADQKVAFDEMLIPARKAMKDLFTRMEDELLGWTSGGKDEMMDGMTDGSRIEELDQIKKWAQRWLIVTRRRAAVEEAWFMEAEAAANALRIIEQQQDKGDANGVMDYET
jgi:nuclear cap-binding protein subunit 1